MKWLYWNKTHLLTSNFIEDVELDDKNKIVDLSIKKYLNTQDKSCPIHCKMITAKDYLTWIVSLRKTGGETPGYSTYNSHRAAFFQLIS